MAKNWAIVVGVNAYRHYTHLDYATRDAEAMRDFFIEAKFDEVVCFADGLKDWEPEFTKVDDFLHDRFTTEIKPLAPGDNIWFFFAGHGERLKDAIIGCHRLRG